MRNGLRLRANGAHNRGVGLNQNRPPRKFYTFGNLAARPEHLNRVRTVLRRHGTLPKNKLIQATRLSMSQTLCAVDALIASGEVAYEDVDRLFRLVHGPS